ncbi:MAG: ribosomal protein L7/L12 [Lachnospiraceae bacterium]|nr:ribosomal protein L7/L12 [Lachnospiraceae bacterium]
MFEWFFGKKKDTPMQAADVIDEAALLKFAERISFEDKQRIISLVEMDRKIEAVKECRELTGAGLKDAKDIVDNYQKYLV